VGSDDWKPVGPDDVDPTGLLTLRGHTGYLASPDGAAMALSASGLQRRGQPCGTTPPTLAAVDDTTVAALCVGGAAAGSSPKTVFVSHDGGRTWTRAGSPPMSGQATAMAAASPSRFVVAASSGASYLYQSTDGGRTWRTAFQDTTTGGAPFIDVGFTDATHGVAVLAATVPRLLVTTDGGTTWSTAVVK
jgi:photosystem II stability/assembly factor-like uncharacterized protein